MREPQISEKQDEMYQIWDFFAIINKGIRLVLRGGGKQKQC